MKQAFGLLLVRETVEILFLDIYVTSFVLGIPNCVTNCSIEKLVNKASHMLFC